MSVQQQYGLLWGHGPRGVRIQVLALFVRMTGWICSLWSWEFDFSDETSVQKQKQKSPNSDEQKRDDRTGIKKKKKKRFQCNVCYIY